jgi:hypothetical protein
VAICACLRDTKRTIRTAFAYIRLHLPPAFRTQGILEFTNVQLQLERQAITG